MPKRLGGRRRRTPLDSLIPQAKDSLSKAETLYKSGSGSYAALIETQSIWLNFNLAAERARADYLTTLCDLEKLTGISLLDYQKEAAGEEAP